MSSQSLLEEERTRIDALLARKSRLLQEVNEIEQELRVAETRHGRLQNSRAPVSTLPDELLADIFQLCQEDWLYNMRPSFELVASHVSSHWREIALATPLLWNNIYMVVRHIPSSPRFTSQVERFSAHLARSASCLLKIYLVLDTSDMVPHFLDPLTRHAKQWQQISISVPTGVEADLYSSLHKISAPALVHLSLRVGTIQNPDAPRTEYPAECPEILMGGGSPALSFVRVAGMIVGRMAPPYSSVTTLHIDAWPKNIMQHGHFQRMLGMLPRLVNLSLTGLSIQLPRDPLDVSSPTPMPSLRSLRIRCNATPCHRLFTLMVLPHLESLSLHNVDTFDSPPMPTLRSLTIEACALSETEVGHMVHAFPAITTLSIDHSVPSIYTMLESDGGKLWPALEEVFQRDLRASDVAPFCLMLLTRVRAEMPLRRLLLNRGSRRVLRAKDRVLDMLTQLLEVDRCDHWDVWPTDLGYEDPDDMAIELR